MKKNQGFTLIELIITISIIGILLLVVTPKTNIYSSYYENVELNNIRSDILATKARAVAEGKMYTFNVREDGYGYTIGSSDTIKRVSLDSVRFLTSSHGGFHFNSQGGVANPKTIKIRCKSNKIFDLKVGVGTGKITLEKAKD